MKNIKYFPQFCKYLKCYRLEQFSTPLPSYVGLYAIQDQFYCLLVNSPYEDIFDRIPRLAAAAPDVWCCQCYLENPLKLIMWLIKEGHFRENENQKDRRGA